MDIHVYRCRKCRQDLEVNRAVIKDIDDCTDGNQSQSSVLYLEVDLCPAWIFETVTKACWTKGKLLCPKCKGRLGSFDFVNQKLCRCMKHNVPATHILKDRIDDVQKRDQASSNCRGVLLRRAAIPRPYSLSRSSPSTSSGSGAQCDIQNAKSKLVSDDKTGSSAIDDSQSDSQRLSSTSEDQISDLVEDDFTSYNMFEVLSVEEDIAECEDEKTCNVMEEIEQEPDIPLDIICAVCLDMFYRPHSCEPCGHVFCEHCLRQLSRQTTTFTPCPLCRNVISKCVLNTELSESINAQFEKHVKERGHEIRQKRKEKYPLPGCTPRQYGRYLQNRGRQNYAGHWAHRNDRNFIITSCFQEILVRFSWVLLLFFLHNVLFELDNWLKWDMYAPYSVTFNYFFLTLTCKLVLLGVIYCVKKYFYISMESQFMGQAVSFVFIFSVLWDSSSWIQCALNVIVLGSLFL